VKDVVRREIGAERGVVLAGDRGVAYALIIAITTMQVSRHSFTETQDSPRAGTSASFCVSRLTGPTVARAIAWNRPSRNNKASETTALVHCHELSMLANRIASAAADHHHS
jgi:hypothetical protein